MLVAHAVKNSQLIRQLPGESHVIYGTGHQNVKTGYLLDGFNPVIIETISFLSVCLV
jgi:hypothetical protein